MARPSGTPTATAASKARPMRDRLAARCCHSVASIKPWLAARPSLASTACGGGKNRGSIQPLLATACQISNSTATLNRPSASG